jgi:hypothetical protein
MMTWIMSSGSLGLGAGAGLLASISSKGSGAGSDILVLSERMVKKNKHTKSLAGSRKSRQRLTFRSFRQVVRRGVLVIEM